MQLYRQPGRTRGSTLLLAVAIACAVGVAIGFGIGRATIGDQSVREALAPLRSQLQTVANGLELLPTEYPQALRGTGAEDAAVTGDLRRIDDALRAARPDLTALDPIGARMLERRIAALHAAIDAKAPPDRVAAMARRAADTLTQLPGGT